MKTKEKDKEKLPTAIYIRLSQEDGDKEESDSVGNQRKILTEYISRMDDMLLCGEYIDDGYTGTNFQRPGFQEMLFDMEKGRIRCVVVKDLSRFGRDYLDAGRYLERIFPEMGIRFVSVADGIDSARQSYDILLPIKNLFNEQYARDISNKIQATVKTKQRAGEFIGSFASYGYQKAPYNKNKLIIDPYAASVVQKIFSLYTGGMGKQSIAKQLNAEGILCPSEYKKVNGENYKNGNRLAGTSYWTYSTVNSVLRNELYIGNMVQGKKHQRMRGKQQVMDPEQWIRVSGTHEPIIEEEVWKKTQRLLSRRQREINLKEGRNIFAGMIKCGDCGRAMTKTCWTKADKVRVYSFCCGTYKRNGKAYCSPHILRMSILEKVILDDLQTIIRNVSDLKELVKRQRIFPVKPKKIAPVQAERLRKEKEHISCLKKGLYEDYKEGLLTRDEFLSYKETYRKKEENCQKQIECLKEAKRQGAQTDKQILDTPWLRQFLESKENICLDRDIIIEMVDEILVYEGNRIKIRYRFSGGSLTRESSYGTSKLQHMEEKTRERSGQEGSRKKIST